MKLKKRIKRYSYKRRGKLVRVKSHSRTYTSKKCPGSKIRSKGKGRGLGIGRGKGPIRRFKLKSGRHYIIKNGKIVGNVSDYYYR